MTVTETTRNTERKRLPDGWRWVQLCDLLTSLETGSRPKGGALGIMAGVPSLSAEHITKNGTLEFSTPRFVPQEFFDQMSRGHIKRGDILIVKDGATTGKTAFVGDELPFQEAVINEHVFLCRPNQEVVFPRYLFFWLWSSEGQSAIRMNYQGAAIGGINQRFTESVFVPLPRLSEQQQIAALLDEKMEVIERARAGTEKQLEVTKALLVAYLRDIFNRSEAQSWPKKRLGDICQLLPSKSIATNGDTEVLAITTACLREDGFQPTGVKKARMWASDAAESVVSCGEILVARSNTPDLVGRVAMFSGDPDGATASDLTIRIWPKDGLEPAFLAAYLSFLYLSGYWKERAGGASGTMKKITRSQIQQELVPVPLLCEQRRIVATATEKIAAVKRMRKVLEGTLATIDKLPTALLRRAFTGGL